MRWVVYILLCCGTVEAQTSILQFHAEQQQKIDQAFEDLKHLDRPILSEQLRSVHRGITAEQLEIIFFRFNYELNQMPEMIPSELSELRDLKGIETLLQIITINAARPEYLGALEKLMGLASRKLYYLQNYTDVWQYQIELAYFQAQFPMAYGRKRERVHTYIEILKGFLSSQRKAVDRNQVIPSFLSKAKSDVVSAYFSDGYTVSISSACVRFFGS